MLGLTYTTPVLQENLEVTGPITLDLVASSTAANLDWVTLGAGEVTVHLGPGGSSILVPVVPARCHRSTPLRETDPALTCARSYESAIRAGS